MKKILLIVLSSVFGFGNENIHTTFSCEFTTYATKSGLHDDVVKFRIITNDNNGTFTIKKNKKVSFGTTIRGDKGLSFIEVTRLGNVSIVTMTIVPPYGNKQQASYSRNILIDGKLISRQYYGTCQLVKGSQTKKVHIPISTEKRYKIYKKLDIEKKLKELSKKDAKYVFSALEGVFPSRQETKEDMSIKGILLVSMIMDEAIGTVDKKLEIEYDSIDSIMNLLDKKSKSRYDSIMETVGKKIDIKKRMKEVTTYDKNIIRQTLEGQKPSKIELNKMSKKGMKLIVEIAAIMLPKEKK